MELNLCQLGVISNVISLLKPFAFNRNVAISTYQLLICGAKR